MENLQDNFDRLCRLCAVEQEVSISLYGAKAEAMLLQNKLNKYLLIEVDDDDKLPKIICIPCCTKLQTVCEFIEKAREAQDILFKRSIELEEVNASTPENNYMKEISIKTEHLDDDDVTQMEISVDPYTVLQDMSPKIGPSVNLEDVRFLHGADGEDVTIKLIRTGEKPSDPLELVETDSQSEKSVEKPYPCVHCKRSFLTELALKNHIWIHICDDQKPFTCSTCGKPFRLRRNFLKHQKYHRSNSTCKICKRIFKNENNLRNHIQTHITPSTAYICNVCGRSYDKISNLKTHSICHSDERPFGCHICTKRFKRNQDLKFHINQHTGAKPYKCPFCDKCFASSGNCYSHRSRVHPGRLVEAKAARAKRRIVNLMREQRPPLPPSRTAVFTCKYCTSTFKDWDTYTLHLEDHTSGKIF